MKNGMITGVNSGASNGARHPLSGHSLYTRLREERQRIEARWHQYAAWSLPHVYPGEVVGVYPANQNFITKQILRLRTKLSEVMFPRNRAPIHMELSQKQTKEYSPTELEGIERELSKLPKAVTTIIARDEYQMVALSAITQLLVIGTAVIDTTVHASMLALTPDEYVLKRDVDGGLRQLVIRTQVSKEVFDEQYAKELPVGDVPAADALCDAQGGYPVYTVVTASGSKQYRVETFLAAQDTAYKSTMMGRDALPYIVSTLQLFRGADYGVGMLEIMAADIDLYDQLAGAISHADIKGMDYRNIVDPDSGIDIDLMNQSATGSYVSGRKDSIQAFSGGPSSTLYNSIYASFAKRERDLADSFMSAVSSVRDASRVTAVEVTATQSESEGPLAGMYLQLANTLQKPLLAIAIAQTDIRKIDATIVVQTGQDALARHRKLNNTRRFIADASSAALVAQAFPHDINSRALLLELAKDNAMDLQLINTLADATTSREAAEPVPEQTAGQPTEAIV